MSPILLRDVMGTLVVEPYLKVLPKFFNMSLKELFARKHPSSWPDFERGEITEDQYFKTFFAEDQPPIDGDGLKQAMYEHYELIEDIEALLNELKDRNVPMYALSNYPQWYLMIEEKLKLSRWLEWKFVSCLTGVRKPDARAYTGPAEALGVPTSACVFVDDREVNCEAAQKTGMTALQFQTAENLRNELLSLGIL